MENKKTFSNFKLLLEAKNIEENGSINIFNSQKLLNSYFKKIILGDFYWNISIKSDVKEVANLLIKFYIEACPNPRRKYIKKREEIIMVYLSQVKHDFKIKENFVKIFYEKVQEPEPDQIIFINRIEKLIKEKDKK